MCIMFFFKPLTSITQKNRVKLACRNKCQLMMRTTKESKYKYIIQINIS